MKEHNIFIIVALVVSMMLGLLLLGSCTVGFLIARHAYAGNQTSYERTLP